MGAKTEVQSPWNLESPPVHLLSIFLVASLTKTTTSYNIYYSTSLLAPCLPGATAPGVYQVPHTSVQTVVYTSCEPSRSYPFQS